MVDRKLFDALPDPAMQALQRWAEQHKLRTLIGNNLATESWLRDFSTPLPELPEEIGLMRALTKIDLRHNGLRRLPASLGQLHRLEDLTSMGNALESLPDVFHDLKRLRYLDLRDNALSALPPSLGHLDHLDMLILHGNRIAELPPEIGRLKKLQRLDLHNNPLTHLPAELQECDALVHLDISGTLITHLPEWLAEMKNLKTLIRGPNQAAEIGRAFDWKTQHPYIAPPSIDNEPFQLWFERALAEDAYGPMKITFRHQLDQDLSDAEIASKARGMVGSEDWPEGSFVWGEDARGEYIEYYLTSRWGDRHGRIDRDGHHEDLPALWQMGPIDEEYEALAAELRRKGLDS